MDRVDYASLENVMIDAISKWSAETPRANERYYKDRLKPGKLLLLSDRMFAKYVSDHFTVETSTLEIGFGYGELSFLLAACDPRRLAE